MNTFASLFGIFRQRGLVDTLREGRSLSGFIAFVLIISLLGGVLYGFAMGIGFGFETAIKDAIKVSLIVLLSALFSIPIFWLTYRLMGREEKLTQVATIPLTMVATTAIILAVTAPMVFMLSLLASNSPEVIYIHLVFVDLALLVGIYLGGTLVYYGFTSERNRLVIPNVVGFVMLGVILVVLILFFAPYLALTPTFSVGTDLLGERLGFGVGEGVNSALEAVAAADRMTYKYQTTNANGDLERDYSISRVGEDFHFAIHLHAVPGETSQTERNIWLIGGEAFEDFSEGRVSRVDRIELGTYLEGALPEEAFKLPETFDRAIWRGYEAGEGFTAIGTTPEQEEARIVLNDDTRRLKSLVIGSTAQKLGSEIRVAEIGLGTDLKALTSSLNQAIVLGDIDRSDTSMQDYVQEETLFAVRFPNLWRAGSWDATKRTIGFINECGAVEGCPGLQVSVFDLAENKGARQYAEELAASLNRQAEYREAKASMMMVGDRAVGVVEYFWDRTVKGQLQTTQIIEYIFPGELNRYHLKFSAPEGQFEANRELFAAIARQFTYLKGWEEP